MGKACVLLMVWITQEMGSDSNVRNRLTKLELDFQLRRQMLRIF
ncbi:MAG: hypothetical protein ACSLEL_04195 [Candidatus Malihini olakiniferum]